LKPKEQVIKIALIQPIPKVIVPPTPTPIIPPVIIPPKKVDKPKARKKIKRVVKKSKKRIVKKRVIKKKKIKRKIKKKKKIAKKRVVKKKIVKQPIFKKPIVKQRQMVQEPEPIIEEFYTAPVPHKVKTVPKISKPIYTPPPPPIPKVDNSALKRSFLTQVRSRIITNKKYPKLALRRHIEGSVRVKFDIDLNGDVSNIRFVSGKSILQKSVRKAVLNSFPINIPQKLREELPINNISVTVNFTIN
jgi:protein TonB